MKKLKISLYKLVLISTICFMAVFFYKVSAFASADNSLSQLSIEGIELDPEFKYSRLKYTAIVEHDITDLEITAIPSNKAAKVLSISGNNNLSVGENIINIVVQAKNGRKVTYSITVTRKENLNSTSYETTENTKENKTDKKKNSPEDLEKKLRKKNKKIKKLNETIDELNVKIQENQINYDSLLKENQKIYSQRIFMIITILLLFFAFLVALFIGNIKKTTNHYMEREFAYYPAKEKIRKTENLNPGKTDMISADNTGDYAIMDREPRLHKNNDNLLSNIETVIANEIRMNEYDSATKTEPKKKEEAILSSENEITEALNLHTDDFLQNDKESPEMLSISEEPKDKKDEFSFDIVEI